MIVYNMTMKVSAAIEAAWLQWMQQEHMPETMASGHFTDSKLFRLLEQDETDGITYVVQYFADTLENYQRFMKQPVDILRQKAMQRWGNQFIAFRTVMQVVN